MQTFLECRLARLNTHVPTWSTSVTSDTRSVMEAGCEVIGSRGLVVCNVKAHFCVTPLLEIPLHLTRYVEKCNNFWTLRLPEDLLPPTLRGHKVVYVVFARKGHVNVTGIPRFGYLGTAQEHFVRLFSTSVVKSIVADNSTVRGHLPLEKLNLVKLYTRLYKLDLKPEPYPCNISIRPHYFPAAVVRPAKASKGIIATAILFSNGKFLIVGSKNHPQALRTVENVRRLVFGCRCAVRRNSIDGGYVDSDDDDSDFDDAADIADNTETLDDQGLYSDDYGYETSDDYLDTEEGLERYLGDAVDAHQYPPGYWSDDN